MLSEEEGYKETTTDSDGPSVLILIATAIICVVCLAIIPSLVSWKRNRDRRRRTPAGSSFESTTEEEQEGKGITSLPDEDDAIADSESVVSKESQASFINAILDRNPRTGPNVVRRPRKYVEKRDRQIENEEKRVHFSKHNTLNEGAWTDNDQDGGDAQLETSSVRAPSALRKLDNDEVSIRKSGGPQGARKEETSVWCAASWSRSFDSLLETAEWNYEMKRIFRLATPFVLSALTESVLEAVNVALIGHLIGTSSLAAYVIVDMLISLSSSLFSGLVVAPATVCSQAIGANNNKLAGQYIQMAVVGFSVCFAPFIVFWMIFMGDTLRWFGYEEETVAAGVSFTRILLFAEWVECVSECFYNLLDVIGKEAYSGLLSVVEEVLSTTGVAVVGLGQDPSLEKVGLVYLFVNAGGMLINVIIIMWKGWFDPYLGGIIGSFAFRNYKGVKLMLKTSVSLSFGELLTYGEWEFLALIAQTLGPDAVTAWGILGTLWDIVEDTTEAVADAAEVRCATLLGSGEPQKAKLSAYKSMYLGTFLALFLSSCVLIMGDDLPTWMTTDSTLQRMVAELIPLFGIGNITLTLGTLAWTIVGSQGRYRLSTAIGFAGSWFVTMPLAVICTIALNLDLRGQTAAVVIGYMVSGTVNSYLLFTSDWEKLSKEVREANVEQDGDSSSSSSSST